jgi:hypothetical protein
MGFISSHWRLLSAFNALFFSVVTGVDLAMALFSPPVVYYGQRVYVLPQFLYGSLPLMILFIFCFNFAFSAFAVVTLPGFLFFPLSSALLAFRAVQWGLILYPLPASLFLQALPTLVLEGEAYVIAAGVGTVVGYSWLKRPEDKSRSEAFARAFKRGASAYVFVVLLLLAAAAVESATIIHSHM